MSLAPVKSSPTAQDSAVISINGLVKQFGRFAALRGVSAEFTPGRLYVILGDNGAGKTTLLRSLAGLAQPTRGTITILGTTDLRTVCGQIGYMAHPSLLYDEMSAMENMRYFARLYEICDDATCARVITAVGLDPAWRALSRNTRKACDNDCRWPGQSCTIRKSCCSMSLFPM